jgi:AcrR family transcriptional regulator
VVVHAAALFNRLGYANASISDIMAATGLQKGGIYRHFGSKEELALEAFDFAVQALAERFEQALAGKRRAPERLAAIIGVYARLPSDSPVPGGCPVLNAAVESDDADPVLKRRVQKVMRDWHAYLAELIRVGQRAGELKRALDAERTATTLVAALEGAIMLSKLHGSMAPMRHVTAHLNEWIEHSLSC